jgi:hypothetical protein
MRLDDPTERILADLADLLDETSHVAVESHLTTGIGRSMKAIASRSPGSHNRRAG